MFFLQTFRSLRDQSSFWIHTIHKTFSLCCCAQNLHGAVNRRRTWVILHHVHNTKTKANIQEKVIESYDSRIEAANRHPEQLLKENFVKRGPRLLSLNKTGWKRSTVQNIRPLKLVNRSSKEKLWKSRRKSRQVGEKTTNHFFSWSRLLSLACILFQGWCCPALYFHFIILQIKNSFT